METFFQKAFVFKLHICFCLSHLIAFHFFLKRELQIDNSRTIVFVRLSGPWNFLDALNLSVKSTLGGSSQIRK